MTWLSTWYHLGPQYAEHTSEQAAADHAETKRQGGWKATHFWSQAREEAS